MSAVCVIPAKGTSKRIPGKNIRMFHGRPIIEYTIEAAFQADCFDDVIVSTDSEEIERIATRSGAGIAHRSPQTCRDDVPMVDAVLEVLPYYNDMEYVCMAYACAPSISGFVMRGALGFLESGKYDSVFPVYRANSTERVLIKRGDYMISRYPEYDNVNSSSFLSCYHSAGQFYFCSVEMVALHKTVMLPRCKGIVIPKVEAVDIDTEEDWRYAEMLWSVD